MNDGLTKCSRCGATVDAGSLQGICPACLLELNLSAPTEELGPEGTEACRPPLPPGPTLEELKRLFPQLEIIEPLGRGGMGAVYKARQPRLDRFVALKILLRRNPDAGSDKAFAERFCREARTLGRLAHQDIVAVYDYGEAGGYPYLIMEFVDGLTLRELLRQGKFTPEQALAIVPKICDALHFAHQQGVVHRDIKPENILIDRQGRVKIADFGIAKIVDPNPGQPALTGGKDVIGTPHYMAPEQIEHPGNVDHRADIFSLGVVFYEMLTGELPLGKFGPPSRKVAVDVRLDEIVLRALEKEPERRYQHISQVKTDVENVSTSGGGRTEPVVRDEAKEAWLRKSAAIAAGGLIVATIGMVATATQVRPGLETLLCVCAAAGFLSAGLHFAKQAWGSQVAGSADFPLRHALTLPPSLLVLCILMIAQGFYALTETVLRQQPGIVIFPTIICLVTGVGLLFLRPWARVLSLAWVWVSYLLYVVLTLVMTKSLFSNSSSDLKIEVMGRATENPKQLIYGILVFVSATLMVPWTHWLLTRNKIKRLFGHRGAPESGKYQKLGFTLGAAIIISALLVWMAMPKRLGTMLSGNVTSAATGEPIKEARVTVIGSKSREWQTTTDPNGFYTIQVPPDAGLLYRDGKVDHSTEPVIRVQTDGFHAAEKGFLQTRSVSYYKRVGDFQLEPLSAGLISRTANVPQQVDANLLHIRRVLPDAETNANTIWVENKGSGEPRFAVDSRIVIAARDIESASVGEEFFSTSGSVNSPNLGLSIRMTKAAITSFAEFTRTNVGQQIAIIIDGKVVSAPIIRSYIPSGIGQITGKFSFAEMVNLSARMNGLNKAMQQDVPWKPANEQELLDLDKFSFSAWPTEVFELSESGLDRFLEKSGADLYTPPRPRGATPFEPVQELKGLGVRQMRMAHLPHNAWTNAPSRAELLDTLSRTNIVAPFQPVLPISEEFSTYAFCTAAGSVGLMRVSVSESKVALAYKTLGPDANPSRTER